MKTTGVIIARFQTPYLHDGHQYLLNEIRGNHNKVVIILGVNELKGSRRNPFDYFTRERMLKQYDANFVVLPISDNRSDEVWSQQLDGLLRSSFPRENFLLYGSRDSFIPHYKGNLPTTALPAAGDYSATAIREEYADKVMDSVDFRMGINYACQNQYDRVNTTVDVAVLHEGNVLLGKKYHTSQFRFPGGFADPTDANFETAAKRELTEECGQLETGKMEYVCSMQVDDWRYRNERDKIITLFYKTTLVYGNPVAADDLEAVQWFALASLPQMMEEGRIAPEHHPLVNQLLATLPTTIVQ